MIVKSHGEVWLPLFQFDFDIGTIRIEATQALATLTPAFDDWETTMWFVEPNSWLGGDAPICVFFHDAPSVLQAARGFLLGSFTEDLDPAAVLREHLEPLGKPLLSGWPAGHATPNRALPLGAQVTLDADAGTLILDEDVLQ